MSYLPLPVRVAAGLMVTAVEQARKLPAQLSELPVTAASRAIQAGMRVQQQVTQLAIKGDEAFSLLHPVEDTPPWARFDEDDTPPPPRAETTAAAMDESGTAKNRVTAVPGSGAGHGSPVRTFGEIDEADVARTLTSPQPTATQPKTGTASLLPAALPGYDELSLAQLRGKLRELSLPQLTELLEYEQVHQDRPAYITLLSNRISTVRAQ